jgi:endonuclease YncB( thermonuclease family)
MWRLITGLCAVVILASPAFAADFSGPVVSVLDGDTLEVLNGHHAVRIRLSGIDCPENGQAYGKKAKQAASDLAFGEDVTVQTHGKDKYTRTLGNVILPNGTNLNQELVKQGWCWWFRKYAPADTVLEGLEKDARDAKKGLWVDPAPIPPWVFRKAKRGQSFDLSALVPLETETEGNVATRGPPPLGVVESGSIPAPAMSPYPIIGNRKSHIYHRPDCPNYSQVAPQNRVAFNSAAAAEEAGYRVARNCP